jgi:hypothetical protein
VAKTSEGDERSYALALLFALGISRGSVADVLQVGPTSIGFSSVDLVPYRARAPGEYAPDEEESGSGPRCGAC